MASYYNTGGFRSPSQGPQSRAGTAGPGGMANMFSMLQPSQQRPLSTFTPPPSTSPQMGTYSSLPSGSPPGTNSPATQRAMAAQYNPLAAQYQGQQPPGYPGYDPGAYPYGAPNPIAGGQGFAPFSPLNSNAMLGDTSVFSGIMNKMEPYFEQRSKDYVSQGMSDAGFMGSRYGSFGAREAARQGNRAATESQAMFQPLLMQNLALNLQNRNSAFDNMFRASTWEQGRQDMFSKMAYEDFMKRQMGFMPQFAPQGQYPTMYGPEQTGLLDYYMMSQMFQGQ